MCLSWKISLWRTGRYSDELRGAHRQTIAQCKAAGVACFVKQLGARPIETYARGIVDFGWPTETEWRTATEPKLRDRKGGDMAEWPEDLRVRELPEVRQ